MKSPNGSVKLEYFPDGSCLGKALQESLEEGYKADYPNDDGGIHPEYCQALHNLLSTYYQDVLGVKGASGVSAPRPLKLRCSDPPLPHGPAAPLPQERRLPRRQRRRDAM